MARMTILSPEDRARIIVQAFSGQTFSDASEAHVWLQRQIETAIREAVNVAADAILAGIEAASLQTPSSEAAS